MKTHEFAYAARNSGSYYVLVARKALSQLPCSVDEIYGLRSTTRAPSKYPAYKRMYTSTYRVFGSTSFSGERPEPVIVEDSNSCYEFFRTLCGASDIPCVSAGGKTNVYRLLREQDEMGILVIDDGAASGPEMAYVVSLMRFKTIRLFLPESFEWLVLSSSLFSDADTRDMLLRPADYIEGSQFFGWEQFFTKELIAKTKGGYLSYSKKTLNSAYLQPYELKAITTELPDLGI